MIRPLASLRLPALLVALAPLLYLAAQAQEPAAPKAGPNARIAVRLDPKLATNPPKSGRIVVVLSRNVAGDLRGRIGDTGMTAAPIFGTDGLAFTPEKTAVIDANSCCFPCASLAELPAGEYTAQAVFLSNPDLNLVRAPGNFFSKAKRISLRGGEAPTLLLTEQEPPEQLPADTDRVKFLKFSSKLLSAFHGRPYFYRAAVVLNAVLAWSRLLAEHVSPSNAN